jgi:aldose 1-epimerase
MGPILLHAGSAIASVDAGRGGRLASLVVRGHELLIGPPDPDDRSIGWGCYLMAPWPGRLSHGRLVFRGKAHQLRRNYGRNAIHGLVFDRPWAVLSRSATEIALETPLGPPSWPAFGRVRQWTRLDPAGVTLTAEIVAEQSMPAAFGWHPWFRRTGADPRLWVQADRFLATKAMMPTGELVAVSGRTDPRLGPRLGSRRLDHAFVGARSPTTIEWPDFTLTVEHEPILSVITVFTPPHAICLEPQTAWANALGLPEGESRVAGALALAAGESLRATMRIAWRPR